MTRDDIIRMAREAGDVEIDRRGRETFSYDSYGLERFAALVAAAERNRALGIAKGMQEELQAKFEQTYMEGVIAGAAAEREACAKVAENGNFLHDDSPEAKFGKACAAAIRARN